jgi:hypothetical protein
MSVIRVCDWCGENIAASDDDSTLSVSHSGDWERRARGGWIGHFHADCYGEVRERLALVLESGRSIERIPVATGQKIGQLRRKHVKPAGHDDAAAAA